MIPGAILCALFLLMPYGGWIPALICAFAGALFAPATAALKGLDFGLIPGGSYNLGRPLRSRHRRIERAGFRPDSHDALGLHGRNGRVSGSRPSASGAARRRTGGLA